MLSAMPEAISRSPRTVLLLGLAFLLLLGGGIGVAWLLARQGILGPLRILLISPQAEASSGLEAAQGRAIAALIQDHLEHFGRFAITTVTEAPTDLEPFRGQSRTLLILTEPRRQGDELDLSYRFVWGKQLSKGAPAPWVAHKAKALPPAQAFDAFLGTFPQAVKSQADGLLPKTATVFWKLVKAGAWRLQNEHLEEAVALAEEATREEPSCASAWILLGNLRYRWMLNSPAAFRQEQAETEAHLQRGLALAPGHPRGTFLLSLLKTDSGNQREALDLLLRARRKQPHNPTLLTGIAYAARGAGLLPLARRAMDLRDALAFARLQPQAVDITCLYTGEIPRFEASLQEQPGHLRSTSGVLPFYRGYLALVRGDHPLARREFRDAANLEHAYPNIRRLSEIYALILEGEKEAAWKKLREYDQERIGMREPDGEFTIRLAEAYAMMGDRASAMEMASRAFARGFGCTAWYERSPMLEPLRGLPKWKALLQHLRERQTLMEGRFPDGVLEEN
jgi:tetratricopeptide (TPR) repeat protein